MVGGALDAGYADAVGADGYGGRLTAVRLAKTLIEQRRQASVPA
jgi:hypothetical protein